MRAHAIETENLEAHVSICQERYTALADRFDSLEQRMDKMETMIAHIHKDIESLSNSHNTQWDRAKDVTIGVLFSVSCFMAYQVFFAV